MKYLDSSKLEEINRSKWLLCYTTVDSDFKNIISKIKPLTFGCSSFQGVFTPNGFLKGTHFLASYEEDQIDAYAVIKSTNIENATKQGEEAIQEILNHIQPQVLLLHATPGYEEKIINGINTIIQNNIPIYGGSAADNDISGKWFIFKNEDFY